MNALAVLDAAHATFDSLRFERRADPTQDEVWSRRIADVIEVRATVAELIAACNERDEAFAAWCSSTERTIQFPGPLYKRSRDADARYRAALANMGGVK